MAMVLDRWSLMAVTGLKTGGLSWQSLVLRQVVSHGSGLKTGGLSWQWS